MNIVIYSDKNDLTEGMYGQALIWLLEILKALQHNDTKIIFDINTLAYDNLIPKFVKPKIEYKIEELENILRINVKQFKSSFRIDFEFNENSFYKANQLWEKYFIFNETILQNIPKFDSNKTLGLHYRGTDKNTDTSQANPINQNEFIMIVTDYLKNNADITTLYCCSDETTFVDNIKQHFPNMKVIEYKQQRANEDLNTGFFRYGDKVDKMTQDEMTIAAFVDMLALSKCNSVLKTSSALSAFSKIINPELRVYTVSAMKERWFPTGLIESYKTTSPEINQILQRTLKGHVYL